MGKRVEIKCDDCGKDITFTGNSVDFRLTLQVERLPALGNFVTDMMIYPPLKEDKYFCGIHCLERWVSAKGWK